MAPGDPQIPRLTAVGAWRKGTQVGNSKQVIDHHPYGGFYTQTRRATSWPTRPSATSSWSPRSKCPVIPRPWSPAIRTGLHDRARRDLDHLGNLPYLLNPDDATIGFMQDILGEVLELFPALDPHRRRRSHQDPVESSPRVQARLRELGLHDESQLQSWFLRQMDDYLTRHNRHLVGWDEILQAAFRPRHRHGLRMPNTATAPPAPATMPF